MGLKGVSHFQSLISVLQCYQILSFEKVFNYIGQRSIFLASRLFSCTIFNISNAPWKIKFYYFEFVLYKKVSNSNHNSGYYEWPWGTSTVFWIWYYVLYYYCSALLLLFYSDAILTQNSILEKRKCNNAAAD